MSEQDAGAAVAPAPELVKLQQRVSALEDERRRRPEHAVDTMAWRRAARPQALVWAVPGFADLWRQEVPYAAVQRLGDGMERARVTCRCGELVELERAVVAVCSPVPVEGGEDGELESKCGRWFLLLESGSVRVKVWPR